MSSIKPSTLVEMLRLRAIRQPNQQAYTFLLDGEKEGNTWTYSQLDRQARAIGALLQSYQAYGERVLLLYPPGLEFIAAFFGCLYAGALAVPAYPPRNKRHLPRIQTIVEDAQTRIVLTAEKTQAKIQTWLAQTSGLQSLVLLTTDALHEGLEKYWQEPDINGQSLAFLQYTSGSTASPKGVMISHANLLHNLELIRKYFGQTPYSKTVIWLPPYHDMGLIAGLLEAAFVDHQVILMAPTAFLQHPVRWLQAISDYRAVSSGGPNFAYDLCVSKITPEQRKKLDLSSWKVAFNGSEPVRAETLTRFAAAFKSCGFRQEAFYPCYGLAEATLFVSGGERSGLPVIRTFQATARERHQVLESPEAGEHTYQMVGCGRNLGEQTIAIVDPAALTPCAPQQIGEIWIAGASVGQGYWQRPELTKEIFQAYIADTGAGPFLRTGDLGFFQDGELFITGRLKDLLIIRGRNHYPQDLEWTVEHSHPAVRQNCSAAFSLDLAGEERLLITAEVERRYRHPLQEKEGKNRQASDPAQTDIEPGFSQELEQSPDLEEALTAIRQAIAEHHDIQVYAILLLKATTIPRTSSGKIQRHLCKIGFLDDRLDLVGKWIERTTKNISPLQGKEAHNGKSAAPQQAFPRADSEKPARTVEVIQNWLIFRLSERLGLEPHEIDVREPFARYGLDSVQAVSLSAELENWLGYKLTPTIVYDYPNIVALSQYLAVSSELSDLSAKIQIVRKAEAETIAVIGLSCRLPGAPDAEAFWQLLHEGRDAITEVPPERWDINAFYDPTPATPGKMNTRWGGFLEQIALFDPEFFGISPREAENMDPQQRLLLEVAWEALENSGHAPDLVAGSYTGVFIGISNYDYARLQGPADVNAYTGSGNALSIAANRLSYLLNLRGPSIALDTACSSSLVAVHQACLSLNHRECDMAFAGGVNLMLLPDITIALSQARMMAADGRCKTFDAQADGYVRGEGCGVVVLKRLSDALRDGDNIRALIRGSAINQDGRTNGLTAPNGFAQQAVIYQALENAGVMPTQISYFEAHGTGTPLGDPIEVNALREVLMSGRSPEHPCWIGSAKTNIGHLEAAAGIAGLIKVVLALQHQEIPPHLHLKQLNPNISLAGTPFSIPTKRQQWDVGKDRRLAGISSFGFGGTNAHVIVEETLAKASVAAEIERPRHILTLSARSAPALAELARRYVAYFTAYPQFSLKDVCFTANVGRAHFEHRLAMVAEHATQAREQLQAFTTGAKTSGIVQQRVTASNFTKIAFLFTGQGSQYVGMGRQLYETQPIFRQSLDRCAEILRPDLPIPLLSVLYPQTAKPQEKKATPHASLLDETAYTQPALFAIEYALAELWRSWRINPTAVLGHSVGEYAAACIAGVFSLEDGLKLIVERARLMQALPRNGKMLAVLAEETLVTEMLRPYARQISIAALNGPKTMVISGESAAIDAITPTLQAAGIKVKPLKVSHAFHSPLMEPILPDFNRVAAEITYFAPRIDVISNVTGQLGAAELAAADYWTRHIRQPVRFATGMATLLQQGYEVFIEIGPTPTLIGLGRQCFETAAASQPHAPILWLPSLRQGQADWQQLLQSLGELYAYGTTVDWTNFDRNYPRRRVALPTYPFQRQRYWLKSTATPLPQSTPQTRMGVARKGHPLLGQRLSSALRAIQFESRLSPDAPAFLADYHIAGTTLLPAAAYVEMALAAGAAQFQTDQLLLEAITIRQALLLPDAQEKIVQVILTPESPRSASFQIFSRLAAETSPEPSWTLHATGKVLSAERESPPPQVALTTLQRQFQAELAVAQNMDYGPSFRIIERLWRQDDELFGQFRLPATLRTDLHAYQCHPVFLEAGLQALAGVFADPGQQNVSWQIRRIERLRVWQRPETQMWGQIRFADKRPALPDGKQDTLTLAEMRLISPDGRVAASLEGVSVQAVKHEILLSTPESLQDWLYQVQWQPQKHPAQALSCDFWPSPEQIRANLSPKAAQLTAQLDLETYQQMLMGLEELSVDYILLALRELDWEFQLARRFTAAELAAQSGVVRQYERLLGRFLEILAEEHWLKRTETHWEVLALPPFRDPQARFRQLHAQYPTAATELTLLARCGSKLAQVLRGQSDPLQLLFPAGDLTTAASLYQDSVGAQAMNLLVQQALAAAWENVPPGQTLRILEIGAGTGGTTAYILPILPAAQVEYNFTDVSPLFTTQAQEKFRMYPFVRYQMLDIEKAPELQGFGRQRFDLVIAANVLHATKDLRQSLQHVKQLLADGGMLVVLEGVAPLRWLDLIFGLTEGWWRFADHDLRPTYPLLGAGRWQELLQELGFAQAVTISPEQGRNAAPAQQAVMIAQTRPANLDLTLEQSGRWLIFADVQGTGQQLATLLRARGANCTLVFPGQTYAQISAHEFHIAPDNLADFQRLLRDTAHAEQPPLRGVIHLWSLDDGKAETLTVTDLKTASHRGCGSVLHLVQALANARVPQAGSLWLVTRGAQPVGETPALAGIASAALWGMGKVIALEHPEIKCIRVDLDPVLQTNELEDLAAEIRSPGAEDQIAFRQKRRYVARLVRSRPPRELGAELRLSFRDDATYLITGGLGGLGLLTAQWMAAGGARQIVLTGRHNATAEMCSQLQEIEQLGAQLTVIPADVSAQADVRRLLAEIERTLPPLRGIIHAAGVLDDGILLQQSPERFARVMAPKIEGAWNLHAETQNLPLDFLVLFSSAAALIGSPGQANHAAANAFLDALAHFRRERGLPGMSINWGPWADIGAAVKHQASAQMSLKGVTSIPPALGLQVLENVFSAPVAQIGVLPVHWPTFFRQFPLGETPLFLAELASAEELSEKSKPSPTKPVDILRQLQKAVPDECQDLLTTYIQTQMAKILGLEAAQIDIQQPLNNLGLDSLMAIELRNRFKTDLEIDVPIVKFLEDLSVRSLAREFAAKFAASQPVPAPAQPDRRESSEGLGQTDRAGQILSQIDQLDDQKVDELLQALLTEKEKIL